jgi:site-specific recombinase XerD
LIANLNTERPNHVRDRAIVLLLAVYGLRIGEVCRLTPYGPMTTHGASSCISVHVRALGCRLPHYGPHSLRHACATHLLNKGFSLKEIGDHLGHRSPRSTQIYAKVERNKLVQVATPQLSSLKEYLRAQTQSITAYWAKERLRSLQEVSNFGLGGLQ